MKTSKKQLLGILMIFMATSFLFNIPICHADNSIATVNNFQDNAINSSPANGQPFGYKIKLCNHDTALSYVLGTFWKKKIDLKALFIELDVHYMGGNGKWYRVTGYTALTVLTPAASILLYRPYMRVNPKPWWHIACIVASSSNADNLENQDIPNIFNKYRNSPSMIKEYYGTVDVE